MSKKYNFFVALDRDGTIIKDKHYLSDPKGVELLPGALEGLKTLAEAGAGLVLVTNQSGIGRGYFTRGDMDKVNARLGEILAGRGVSLDAVYFCPHAPGEECECRKPATGMLEQACADLGLAPGKGVVIGDKACDVELGQALGAKGILVRTGKGKRTENEGICRPDAICDDLVQAARAALEFLGI